MTQELAFFNEEKQLLVSSWSLLFDSEVTSTNYLQCPSQVNGPIIVVVLVLMDVLSMGAPIGAWIEGCSSSYRLLCLLSHPTIVLDLWLVG